VDFLFMLIELIYK